MRTLVTEMEPCADPCKPREGLGRKWISEAIKPGEEGARVCCQETFQAGATWHHSLGVRCQDKAKPAQTLDWKPTTNPTSATSSDIWRISHVGRDVENARYHHLGLSSLDQRRKNLSGKCGRVRWAGKCSPRTDSGGCEK